MPELISSSRLVTSKSSFRRRVLGGQLLCARWLAADPPSTPWSWLRPSRAERFWAAIARTCGLLQVTLWTSWSSEYRSTPGSLENAAGLKAMS